MVIPISPFFSLVCVSTPGFRNSPACYLYTSGIVSITYYKEQLNDAYQCKPKDRILLINKWANGQTDVQTERCRDRQLDASTNIFRKFGIQYIVQLCTNYLKTRILSKRPILATLRISTFCIKQQTAKDFQCHTFSHGLWNISKITCSTFAWTIYTSVVS